MSRTSVELEGSQRVETNIEALMGFG